VLIPVTGNDMAGALTNILINSGLFFLGLGLLFTGLGRRWNTQ